MASQADMATNETVLSKEVTTTDDFHTPSKIFVHQTVGNEVSDEDGISDGYLNITPCKLQTTVDTTYEASPGEVLSDEDEQHGVTALEEDTSVASDEKSGGVSLLSTSDSVNGWVDQVASNPTNQSIIIEEDECPLDEKTTFFSDDMDVMSATKPIDCEPVADASFQTEDDNVANASPQENEEAVVNISLQEKEQAVANASPQENEQAEVNISPQENQEVVADTSSQEKEEVVVDSSPLEKDEPVAAQSNQNRDVETLPKEASPANKSLSAVIEGKEDDESELSDLEARKGNRADAGAYLNLLGEVDSSKDGYEAGGEDSGVIFDADKSLPNFESREPSDEEDNAEKGSLAYQTKTVLDPPPLKSPENLLIEDQDSIPSDEEDVNKEKSSWSHQIMQMIDPAEDSLDISSGDSGLGRSLDVDSESESSWQQHMKQLMQPNTAQENKNVQQTETNGEPTKRPHSPRPATLTNKDPLETTGPSEKASSFSSDQLPVNRSLSNYLTEHSSPDASSADYTESHDTSMYDSSGYSSSATSPTAKEEEKASPSFAYLPVDLKRGPSDEGFFDKAAAVHGKQEKNVSSSFENDRDEGSQALEASEEVIEPGLELSYAGFLAGAEPMQRMSPEQIEKMSKTEVPCTNAINGTLLTVRRKLSSTFFSSSPKRSSASLPSPNTKSNSNVDTSIDMSVYTTSSSSKSKSALLTLPSGAAGNTKDAATLDDSSKSQDFDDEPRKKRQLVAMLSLLACMVVVGIIVVAVLGSKEG